MFGFTNLSVHHSNGDDVPDLGFHQVGTHTDEVPMLDPTTSGVDKNNDATTSVVADNSMKKGMVFSDIVHGYHPPSQSRGLTLSYMPRRSISSIRSRSRGSHLHVGICIYIAV